MVERQLLESIAASGIKDKDKIFTNALAIEDRINHMIGKLQSKINSNAKYSQVTYSLNRQSLKDLFESILTIYDMVDAPVVDQNDLIAKAIDSYTASELLDGQKVLKKIIKVNIF